MSNIFCRKTRSGCFGGVITSSQREVVKSRLMKDAEIVEVLTDNRSAEFRPGIVGNEMTFVQKDQVFRSFCFKKQEHIRIPEKLIRQSCTSVRYKIAAYKLRKWFASHEAQYN